MTSIADEAEVAGSWIWQMVREGAGHVVIGLVIWLFLFFIAGWSANDSALCVAFFFIGREVRDFEIELLPDVMRSAGFPNWNGLRPSTPGLVGQLRHSISGWLPVTAVAALVAYLF